MSGFTDSQVRALTRRVPERHLKSRINAGRTLTYIEGWYALAQANRIFGFDGWDRESLETRCILAREIRGVSTAVYSARVRVAVHADGRVVIRDGHGTGEAHGASPAEVHDRALKSAETDATKRALATFGKAFGLALYAGGRRTAAKGDRPAPSNIERDGGQPDEPASNGKPVAGLIGESRSSRIPQPESATTLLPCTAASGAGTSSSGSMSFSR
jgi:recombination DNA repair RAD52 pathway protein